MGAGDRTTFEETPENLAAEEAAFEAAVNGTDQAPASEASATQTAEEAAAEGTGQEQQQETEQAEAAAAAATEQQPEKKEPTIADLLAIIEESKTEQQKLRDKVFGKVGELQQKIDAVRTTAHGISPKARERLMADFPELAEMLFEVQAEPAQASEQQAVEIQHEVVIPAPAEDPTKVIERRLLTRDHRDWEQVVTSPEFAAWKTTVLAADEAAVLDESWDADYISGKIADFKNWKAGEAKKAQQQKQKQERLNDALIPRGIPRQGTSSLGDDDEEAAMLAAYGRK